MGVGELKILGLVTKRKKLATTIGISENGVPASASAMLDSSQTLAAAWWG